MPESVLTTKIIRNTVNESTTTSAPVDDPAVGEDSPPRWPMDYLAPGKRRSMARAGRRRPDLDAPTVRLCSLPGARIAGYGAGRWLLLADVLIALGPREDRAGDNGDTAAHGHRERRRLEGLRQPLDLVAILNVGRGRGLVANPDFCSR